MFVSYAFSRKGAVREGIPHRGDFLVVLPSGATRLQSIRGKVPEGGDQPKNSGHWLSKGRGERREHV